MTTYKKQLKDKDGNTIYPDVGLDLDSVVYSDDPESVGDDYIDPASYSTDEKKTGGTWIDGKPVYRRVFSGTCSNTANVRANTTLWRNSPVDTILSIGGQVQYNTDAKSYNTLPFGSDGASEFRYVYKQGGTGNINLAVLSKEALTARKYVVIMEYTKTTD